MKLFLKVRTLESWLFDSGWRWVLLPVFAYLFARATKLPIFSAAALLDCLNFILLVLFTHWGVRTVRTVRSVPLGSRFFWIALFLLFWVPGAYLEFPGDPWEHARRIFSFPQLRNLAESEVVERMAYFWAWTIGRHLPLDLHREFLDLYSAFWQLALSVQFYRFVRKFGASPGESKLHVLAIVISFGTNVFSWRYYALSSTPLAYIGYLQALMLVKDVLDGRRDRKIGFDFALALMLPLTNHFQELLLFLISAGAITGTRLLGLSRTEHRNRKLAVILGAVVAGLFFGIAACRWFPGSYGRFHTSDLTFFGTVPLFSNTPPVIQTLGILGALSLLLAVLGFRLAPSLAAVSLSPLIVLLFPPAVWILGHFLSELHDTYRLFYVIPSSIVVIRIISEGWVRQGKGGTPYFPFAIVLGLSVIPTQPFFGRLWFAIHRPNIHRQLLHLYPTASALLSHQPKFAKCPVITDDVTRFFFQAHLGWRPFRLRFQRADLKDRIATWIDFYDELQYYRACGILLANPISLPDFGDSPVAKYSRHWHPDQGNLKVLLAVDQQNRLIRLVPDDWKRTALPSGYILFEPPANQINNPRLFEPKRD